MRSGFFALTTFPPRSTLRMGSNSHLSDGDRRLARTVDLSPPCRRREIALVGFVCIRRGLSGMGAAEEGCSVAVVAVTAGTSPISAAREFSAGMPGSKFSHADSGTANQACESSEGGCILGTSTCADRILSHTDGGMYSLRWAAEDVGRWDSVRCNQLAASPGAYGGGLSSFDTIDWTVPSHAALLCLIVGVADPSDLGLKMGGPDALERARRISSCVVNLRGDMAEIGAKSIAAESASSVELRLSPSRDESLVLTRRP